MSSSLELALRQTLFLVKEAPATRGILPPAGLTPERVVTTPELLSRFRVAKETHRRVVLVVAETEYSESLELLRHSAGSDAVRFGIIAVATSPELFLGSHSDSPELLDVLSSENPDPFIGFRFG